jgi:hypothetical protein
VRDISHLSSLVSILPRSERNNSAFGFSGNNSAFGFSFRSSFRRTSASFRISTLGITLSKYKTKQKKTRTNKTTHLCNVVSRLFAVSTACFALRIVVHHRLVKHMPSSGHPVFLVAFGFVLLWHKAIVMVF